MTRSKLPSPEIWCLTLMSFIVACAGRPGDKLESSRRLFLDSVLVSDLIRNVRVLSDRDVSPPGIFSIPEKGTFMRELEYLSAALEEPDTMFLKSQLRARKEFSFDGHTRPDFKIINLKEVKEACDTTDFWNCFHKNVGEGYYSIGMPVFSKDGRRAFLRLSFHCGYYCASGQDYVFENVRGRWKIKQQLGSWVS